MDLTGAKYDSELQMFCEPEHPLDINVLCFMRWLVETDRLQDDDARNEQEN